jgi:GNAT superfamily N-acetyltransferase
VLAARAAASCTGTFEAEGSVIGVLCVSRPTLNAWWRDAAWPGDYQAVPREVCAASINRDLRTISRVIVDPSWRAGGVGSALVRAYLKSPLTPRTEALSAMGRVCPLFERAGMRRIEGAPSARAADLTRELETRSRGCCASERR